MTTQRATPTLFASSLRIDMKAVLFDLDGTLLNTLDDIILATNHVLGNMGYPRHTREELIPLIGAGGYNLIRRALPCWAEETDVESAIGAYRAYYTPEHMPRVAPYEGIVNAVATLIQDGYAVGIVSNKSDTNVRYLANRFFPDISVTVGVTPDRPVKPDPTMCEVALNALGASRDACVFVGDTEVDRDTARNLGVPCIGLSWGFRGRAALEELGFDAVVDTADELVKTIRVTLGVAKE